MSDYGITEFFNLENVLEDYRIHTLKVIFLFSSIMNRSFRRHLVQHICFGCFYS